MGPIKKLTSDHHSQAARLFSLTLNNHQKSFLSPWNQGQFLDELSRAKSVGYFEGDDLRAFILFRVYEGDAEITLLVTHPGFRRKGYMKVLLGHLMEKTHQIKSLWLEVHEKNDPAQRLYQSLGFLKQGLRPRYYRDGGSALLLEYKSLL